MNWLAVFFGGGTGSVLRYLLSGLIPVSSTGLPLATLAANLTASFLLGILSFAAGRLFSQDHFRLFFTAGLCGGFSTFSTFSAELYRMWQSGAYALTLLYVMFSLCGSVFAFAAGTVVVRMIR
jgi:CrcB protein